MYEYGSNRDGEDAEQIWNLQDLNDRSAAAIFPLQQKQLLGEKTELDVPTTVLETQKLIAQGLVTRLEN